MSADSFMSIAQVGLVVQSSKTQTNLAAAVVEKSLDVQRTEGALAIQLIESVRQAAPPPQGLIDIVA